VDGARLCCFLADLPVEWIKEGFEEDAKRAHAPAPPGSLSTPKTQASAGSLTIPTDKGRLSL
jgi:hypothetical protein